MNDVKSSSKLKFWPTPQDFNEAVQNPHVNLGDDELKGGIADSTPLGIPRAISGAFASVYKMTCGDRDWAVRCFLREIPDTQWRYGRIADHLRKQTLPYIVGFDFQFSGIRVAGRWFPILKMNWVEGNTLDNYVREKIASGGLQSSLAENFKTMCMDLGACGIAHGDLQHGNILVSNGELKLVDYDGMFVPHINAPHSNELGHRNYQHPARRAAHFGEYLDNFSSWVIYTSLKCLALDPSLLETLHGCDDCLLFRSEDFLNPLDSGSFAVLENHENQEIRELAKIVRSLLGMNIETIPSLHNGAPVPADLPPLRSPPDGPRNQASAQLSDTDHRDDYEARARQGALRAQIAQAVAADPDIFQHVQESSAQPKVVWRIEPELFKPVPRRITLNHGCGRLSPILLQMAAFGVVIAVFILLSVLTSSFVKLLTLTVMVGLPMLCILSLMIWWVPLAEATVVAKGTPMHGRVISKGFDRTYSTITLQGTALEHAEIDCKVNYEYPRTRNGKVETVRATAHLSLTQYHNIEENDEITVVYLPNSGSVIYKFSYFKAR